MSLKIERRPKGINTALPKSLEEDAVFKRKHCEGVLDTGDLISSSPKPVPQIENLDALKLAQQGNTQKTPPSTRTPPPTPNSAKIPK